MIELRGEKRRIEKSGSRKLVEKGEGWRRQEEADKG